MTSDVTGAVLMSAMAAAMAAGGPSALVIAIGVVNSVVFSAYDPATSALIPQVVGERDLAAANALKARSTTSPSWPARPWQAQCSPLSAPRR